MSIVLFNLSEGPFDVFVFDTVGVDSTPTTNIDYSDVLLTDTVGFHDACYWIQDVVDRLQESNQVYLTDTVGFNDTLLAPEGSIIETPDWGADNVWSDYNNSSYLTNTIFDSVAFNDILSYTKQLISDSELFPWNYSDVWNDDYGWDDSGLVDLEKLITLFDSIGFQDGLDHNLGFIYEEWETTIWDYTRVWEESYSFIWEGKSTAIEISTDDSFGFHDGLESTINYANISLSDFFSFDDSIPLYDTYTPIEDHFSFDDSPSYLPITTEKTLTDSAGFQETIDLITIWLSTLIDTVGLQDTPTAPMVFLPDYIYDDFGFTDSIFLGDIIIEWFGRTHNKYTGYGGFPYGDIGYGEGYLTDVLEYKKDIYVDSVLLKSETVALVDKTDQNYINVYSRTENETDNGLLLKYPAFHVYQVDNFGNLSDVKIAQSVIHSNYYDSMYTEDFSFLSGLKVWLKASSISASDGDRIAVWSDSSGNGNHFNNTGGIVGRYPYYYSTRANGKPAVYFDGSQQTYMYGVNTAYTGSVYSIIFLDAMWAGLNGRTLGLSSTNWLLGHHGGLSARAYFDGWVYAGSDIIVNYKYHVWACTIGGAGVNSTFYKNGCLLASNQNGIHGPTGSGDRWSLGGSSYSEWSTFCTPELLVFNRVLSEGEIKLISNSLATKYSF